MKRLKGVFNGTRSNEAFNSRSDKSLLTGLQATRIIGSLLVNKRLQSNTIMFSGSSIAFPPYQWKAVTRGGHGQTKACAVTCPFHMILEQKRQQPLNTPIWKGDTLERAANRPVLEA